MADSSFIVGDAGGTNTCWRAVNGDKIQQFKTTGFNAYTHNSDDFQKAILETLGPALSHDVKIYLYAAGVDTKRQKQEIEKKLSGIFNGHFTVENDLVGVARSLCGDNQGNVCILGTGSNACYYNGEVVDKVSASLGYVLGDEGSGAYLGKKLLMGVFRKQLSPDIVVLFNERYDLDSYKVIQQVYHKPRPNHFLASFAPFIHEHRHHPDIYRLVYQSFKDFYHAFFFQPAISDTSYHFSGSIAHYFSDILRQVGIDMGIHIQNIVESPIAGLVLYHKSHE